MFLVYTVLAVSFCFIAFTAGCTSNNKQSRVYLTEGVSNNERSIIVQYVIISEIIDNPDIAESIGRPGEKHYNVGIQVWFSEDRKSDKITIMMKEGEQTLTTSDYWYYKDAEKEISGPTFYFSLYAKDEESARDEIKDYYIIE